jgi:hypothetical protein
VVASPDSRPADNVDASCSWDDQEPFRRLEAGKVAAAFGAASTASGLEVGDAGNGYPASLWKVRCPSRRSRGGKDTEQATVGKAVKAVSSRVGDLAGAHDN